MATLRSPALARGKEYKGSSKKAPVLLRAESGEKMLDSLQFLEKLAGASIASRIFSLVNSYCVIPRPPGDVQNYPASLMRQLLLCGSANKLLRGATVGCGFEKFPNLVGIISDQDGLECVLSALQLSPQLRQTSSNSSKCTSSRSRSIARRWCSGPLRYLI